MITPEPALLPYREVRQRFQGHPVVLPEFRSVGSPWEVEWFVPAWVSQAQIETLCQDFVAPHVTLRVYRVTAIPPERLKEGWEGDTEEHLQQYDFAACLPRTDGSGGCAWEATEVLGALAVQAAEIPPGWPVPVYSQWDMLAIGGHLLTYDGDAGELFLKWLWQCMIDTEELTPTFALLYKAVCLGTLVS